MATRRSARTPADEEAALPASVAEERISVATQWQLMWWRFRKHRLAMVGTVIVIVLLPGRDLRRFPGLFRPAASEAQRSLCRRSGIHWFDKASLRPTSTARRAGATR